MGSFGRLGWLAAIAVLSCSSGEDSSSGQSTGVCVGKGWKDTCHYLASCSNGKFELVCGWDGGTDCACIHDDVYQKSVAKQTDFCNPADGGADKYDVALAAAASACDWKIGSN